MAFKVIEGPESGQGSPEWKAFRRGKIGASMAAAILGIDPWTTKLQLWEQIVNSHEKPVTPAMQRGKDLEAQARELVSDLYDYPFQPVVLQSHEYPDLIASLDGFFVDSYGVLTIVEIKSPNQKTHQDAIDGKIPDHYFAQMQHQMIVSGVDQMLYCSFDGENIVVLTCKKDEEFCEDLIVKEMAFIASLINFDPPSTSDKDWKEIDDPEAILKVFEYKQLKMQKESLENQMEELETDLVSRCSYPRMCLDDFKMRKMAGKVTIDYKLLLRDHHINPSEKYLKKGKDYWKITC